MHLRKAPRDGASVTPASSRYGAGRKASLLVARKSCRPLPLQQPGGAVCAALTGCARVVQVQGGALPVSLPTRCAARSRPLACDRRGAVPRRRDRLRHHRVGLASASSAGTTRSSARSAMDRRDGTRLGRAHCARNAANHGYAIGGRPGLAIRTSETDQRGATASSPTTQNGAQLSSARSRCHPEDGEAGGAAQGCRFPHGSRPRRGPRLQSCLSGRVDAALLS